MNYDSARRHRRSIRLQRFDYVSAGAYFVTLCTKDRACVLIDPVIAGIINDVWQALPGRFPTIELDEFVVMPNHVHLIVWLLASDTVGAGLAPAQIIPAHAAPSSDWARLALAPTEWRIPQPDKTNLCPSLGEVIGTFKSLVFTVYLDWIESHDPARRAKFWQRNYYEHVIRSDPELNAIRRYIQANPIHWNEDRDNVENIRRLQVPASVDEYLEDVQLLMNASGGT